MQAKVPPGPDGLPPVAPPSGKFIAQLFLVPLLIVAVIALFLLGFLWLFGGLFGGLGGARTPAQFLDQLDRSNPEARWRAAADLSQRLLRDDQLASDPRFALDLAERMRKALDAAAPSQKAVAERLRKHPHLAEHLGKLVQGEPDPQRDPNDPEWKALEKDWKALEPEVSYASFLGACLGNFMLPVGAPLLGEVASREEAEPNLILALQRRKAVWALANLGENLKRFDKLPPERQAAVVDALRQEADARGDERGAWAEAAREVLEARREGKPRAGGVDLALVKCSEEPQDPFLRLAAGYAMGFWRGTPEEDRRMEDALLRLTSDPGGGDETLARLSDNPENRAKGSRPVTAKPGLLIHYNATTSLAEHGSARTPLPLLEEMLDEEVQLQSHRLQRPDGTETPDQGTAYLTLVTALKATAKLHARNPGLKLGQRESLTSAVDRLKESKNVAVRNEAERTRKALSQSE